LLHDVDSTTVLNLQWKTQNEWPTPFDFRKCVNLYGINNGFRMVSDANSKPACASNCKPTGCGRCSEEVGDGKIFGHVMDRIWLQPVPTARVTLQYRGINIDQTMTDQNGRFEFDKLSTRGDCNLFRLVIDKYDNNICTELAANRPANGCLRDIALSFDRAVDESKNGGYWSYTTENFSIENFPYKEMLGMIYIYPRPNKGEGYVTYGRPQLFTDTAWQKVKDCQQSGDQFCLLENVSMKLPWSKFWAPHIVWPENQARLHPWSGSGVTQYGVGTVGWDLCAYDKRGTTSQHSTTNGQSLSCARDYNWMNQGSLNLSLPPYSGIACPALLWDFDKATNCPVAGTTLCKEQCLNTQGFWRLVWEWTGMTFTGAQCDNFCRVGTTCPATVSTADLMKMNRCHLGVNNAQSTGLFRYENVSNLTEPLNIYFSGAEYEPIRGEYFFTAALSDSEFNAWSRETNPQKPNVYASLSDLDLPDRALSWREVWTKTNVKVYVSTDKGLYAITPTGGNTRADFRRPFWHMASIGTNGEVTVANSWRNVGDLAAAGLLPSEVYQGISRMYQPDTPLVIPLKYTKTALRPPGLACWNIFGAACQQFNNTPWTLSCLANQDKGILNYFAADSQTYNQVVQNQTSIWNGYFSRPPTVINETASCGINEDPIRYNSINW
jgi:hypothetical protein